MKKINFLIILFSFISTIQLTHCFRFYNAIGQPVIIEKRSKYAFSSETIKLERYSQHFLPYEGGIDKIKFLISIPDLNINQKELNLDQYPYDSLEDSFEDIIVLILDPSNNIREKLIHIELTESIEKKKDHELKIFREEIEKEFEDKQKRSKSEKDEELGISTVIGGSHCIIQ